MKELGEKGISAFSKMTWERRNIQRSSSGGEQGRRRKTRSFMNELAGRYPKAGDECTAPNGVRESKIPVLCAPWAI